MKNFQTTLIASLLFLVVAALPLTAHATFVVPKRVQIEQGQNAKALTIYNRTDKTIVYTFDWERRAMSPTGERLLLKDGETTPNYKPADDMLVFSPRQVTVKPGESQKVRIMVRRPANLAEGEYHSHILIKPEPLKSKVELPKEKGLAGSLAITTYMSIPIFVRHGKTHVNIKPVEAVFTKKKDQDALQVTLENDSTRSVHARIALDCGMADGTSREVVFGAMRVYQEAKKVTESFITPQTADLASCQSLVMNVSLMDDFEFKDKQSLVSLKVR